jgi:hypothetical protein
MIFLLDWLIAPCWVERVIDQRTARVGLGAVERRVALLSYQGLVEGSSYSVRRLRGIIGRFEASVDERLAG